MPSTVKLRFAVLLHTLLTGVKPDELSQSEWVFCKKGSIKACGFLQIINGNNTNNLYKCTLLEAHDTCAGYVRRVYGLPTS
jgi:hypothetical protein